VALALGFELLAKSIVVRPEFGYERVTLTRGGLVRHGVRHRVKVDVTPPVRPFMRAKCATLYALPDGGL
jgi:hypothetical protein